MFARPKAKAKAPPKRPEENTLVAAAGGQLAPPLTAADAPSARLDRTVQNTFGPTAAAKAAEARATGTIPLSREELNSIAAAVGRDPRADCGEDAAARAARYAGEDDNLTRRMRGRLKPHQRRSLAHLETRLAACPPRAGGILADRCGLGKTCTAIVLLTRELRIGRARRVIIAVPAALIGSWCLEFDKALAAQPATERPGWRRAWESVGGAIVLSYDRLTRDFDFLYEQCSEADVLALDEAHNFGNTTAQRHRAATSFPGRRLLISGTPLAEKAAKRDAVLGLVTTAEERSQQGGEDGGGGGQIEGDLLRRVAIAHDFASLVDKTDAATLVPRQLIVGVKLELAVPQPAAYPKTTDGRTARKDDDKLVCARRQQFALEIVFFEVRRGRSVMVCSTRLLDLRQESPDGDLKSMAEALGAAAAATATLPTGTSYVVHTLEGANTQEATAAALGALESARAGSGPPVVLLVSSSYVTGYNLQGVGCAVMLREENRPLLNRQMLGRIRRLGSTAATTVFRLTVACPMDEARRERVRAGEIEQEKADGFEKYYKYHGEKPAAELKGRQRSEFDPRDRLKQHDGDLHGFLVPASAVGGTDSSTGGTGGARRGGNPGPVALGDITSATWSEMVPDDDGDSGSVSDSAPATPGAGASTPAAKRTAAARGTPSEYQDRSSQQGAGESGGGVADLSEIFAEVDGER